jgi:ribosomal protein S1
MKIEKNNYVYGIDPDKPRDKYQKGRKFKARVKNITPDKVELEVEEGVMSARLETRMGVGIGDIVEFEVTDRDEDRITLKHIKQEKLDDKFDMRI